MPRIGFSATSAPSRRSNAAAPAAQAAQPVQAAAPAVDTVAELQKYKMLMDTGVITEEEFAAKKKQLLGI